MELRHFRYFVAVAKEGHATRAAERLGIQQPPLSQQIQALERELDAQLFRRKPRGVELTPAGRALYDEARAILARVDEAVAATRRAAQGEAGRIGIGFTSSASFHPFVPRAIRAFREAHPLVALALEESGTTELVAALRAQAIDAAFVRSPVGESADLFVRPLLEEPMVAALPSGHCLVGRKRLCCRWPRSPARPSSSTAGRSGRAARRDHRRLRPRRVQPENRPGGAAHAVDLEPRRRRARGHRGAGVDEPAGGRRRRLSPDRTIGGS